ncbi:hypothetical protein V6N13_109398 [Hibiscus sabdariffa]|uniref:DUF4283 domain-containing protein n=1 Tax=Hibiscus sabdariffa TaxID=183260 RepID=A0ABR2FPF0_9ROSI
MMELGTGGEHSGCSNPGALVLGEFPPLASGALAATVESATINSVVGADVAVGATVEEASSVVAATAKLNRDVRSLGKGWSNLFSDQSLPFHAPVELDGKILVQPPREVMDLGARQWDNALLGKSPHLNVFQRTVDNLWGREGSILIRFLVPSVYLINFPSCRKDCVEVLATYALPSSIIVDLGNGSYVDVVIELDWAPPCCSSCGAFGHATDKCKITVVPEVVVQDVGVSPVDTSPLVEALIDTSSLVDVNASVVGRHLAPGLMQAQETRDLNSIANSVDNFTVVNNSINAELGVGSVGDKVVNFPDRGDLIVLSSNKFDALCAAVEGRIPEETSRPERAAAVGVVNLMEKLRPKERKKRKG